MQNDLTKTKNHNYNAKMKMAQMTLITKLWPDTTRFQQSILDNGAKNLLWFSTSI